MLKYTLTKIFKKYILISKEYFLANQLSCSLEAHLHIHFFLLSNSLACKKKKKKKKLARKSHLFTPPPPANSNSVFLYRPQFLDLLFFHSFQPLTHTHLDFVAVVLEIVQMIEKWTSKKWILLLYFFCKNKKNQSFERTNERLLLAFVSLGNKISNNKFLISENV